MDKRGQIADRGIGITIVIPAKVGEGGVVTRDTEGNLLGGLIMLAMGVLIIFFPDLNPLSIKPRIIDVFIGLSLVFISYQLFSSFGENRSS